MVVMETCPTTCTHRDPSDEYPCPPVCPMPMVVYLVTHNGYTCSVWDELYKAVDESRKLHVATGSEYLVLSVMVQTDTTVW